MNKKFLVSLIIAFIYYLILDGTMIYLFMGNRFKSMIKKIQNGEEMKAKIIPAVLCFVVLAFGISYFIIDKVRDTHIIEDSLKYGALFGFVIYAVYDLTNYATFNKYTLSTTIIDIIWGTTLAFLVTVLTKYTLRFFK